MEALLHQILQELRDIKEGQKRLEEQMDAIEGRMDSMDEKLDAVYEQVMVNTEKLTETEDIFYTFKEIWFDQEHRIRRLERRSI
ncbi:MAG: hypothetical protein GX974_02130 [Clostridiales bacterium]|nr:hypothetical protein [Clostridiales bacterium]